MNPIWASIDASRDQLPGVDATTRITGLPIIVRLVRMAARQGWQGAVVHAPNEATRRALAVAVSAQPPPSGFTVEYSAEPPPDSNRKYMELDACSIYRAEALAGATQEERRPDPWVRLDCGDDIAVADAALMQLTIKSIDHEGVVCYYTQRPLSRPFVRALLNTRVSPNQVTMVAMVCGIVAAFCAAIGSYLPLVAAGFLYWLGTVIDCVDGGLARLRLQSSKMGEWLDTLADDISTYGLLVGLGVGLMRSGHSDLWGLIGIGGGILGALVSAKLYADLHRMKLPIDTAQYPWFFGTPADGSAATNDSLRSKFVYYISFLFRRDAFVTAIAILLAFDLGRVAAAVLATGVAVIVAMFVIHTIVTSVRGQANA